MNNTTKDYFFEVYAEVYCPESESHVTEIMVGKISLPLAIGAEGVENAIERSIDSIGCRNTMTFSGLLPDHDYRGGQRSWSDFTVPFRN